MVKYFLDTSAIWRIRKIKKYANFPIAISSESKNRWLLRLLLPNSEITTWHYINTSKKDIELNGELKVLDVPAQLINDKTLIPLRFISEELGFTVNWDDDGFIAEVYGDSTVAK